MIETSSRLTLMFKAWSVADAELLDFSDALGFGPKKEAKKKDSGISTKINRELNKLERSDPRSALVAENLVKIAGEYGERFTANSCKDALLGSDHKFLSFLSKYCAGAPTTVDEAGTADESVGGDTYEVSNKGSGNNTDDRHLGDRLAPAASSGYVGVKWPYPEELRHHFGSAYRAIFGGVPKDKTPQEQVFFFYRLGLEGADEIEPGDGAIRIQDEQLRLVIRRVPARICYEDPFDEWLTYEEAYYNEHEGLMYRARGVIYGFNGGMTLLCRDETARPREQAFRKKLALAHFDFRPALDSKQTVDRHPDAHALQYYIGSIAMESDVTLSRHDRFCPTAYRCLLRKAPNGTKWDEAKAQAEDSPGNTPEIRGKSATKSLYCDRGPDGKFDLNDGKKWGEESDLKYGDKSYSWSWYFNQLNINRHTADLLVACPSVYSRWPTADVGVATIGERQPLRNAGRPRRDRPHETEQE